MHGTTRQRAAAAVLLEESGADIAESHALRVPDGRAPWGDLGDHYQLLDAGQRRGFVLLIERKVTVARVRVVPASLPCEDVSNDSLCGARISSPFERLKMSWNEPDSFARIGCNSSSVLRRYRSVWLNTGPSVCGHQGLNT